MSAPALSNAVRGIWWMVLGAFFFACIVGVARKMGTAFSAFELVFYQCLVTIVLMAPWLIRVGRAGLRTQRWGVYGFRAVAGVGAMGAMLFAIRHMPLADVTALLFTTGLFTVLLASLILREPVGLRRWVAVAVGFVGALIVIRPGFAGVSWPVLVMFGSALGFAAVNVSTRLLAYTEDANAMVFYMYGLMMVLAVVPAAPDLRLPTAAELPWLGLLGIVTLLGQQGLTRSFAAAPPSVVMPAYYLQLPFSALIGYFAYEETPDVWIWVGAAIICASTYYIVRLETAARGQA